MVKYQTAHAEEKRNNMEGEKLIKKEATKGQIGEKNTQQNLSIF